MQQYNLEVIVAVYSVGLCYSSFRALFA